MHDDSVTRFIAHSRGDAGGTPAQLVILEGAEPGIRYDLLGSVTSLGRRPDNDLVLSSASISKYHGRISQIGAEFYVEDLGSMNGIVVNSSRLEQGEKRRLCHGDTLRMSDHLLLFRNPRPLSDALGMSTITFDADKVKEEVDEIFKDLGGFQQEASQD